MTAQPRPHERVRVLQATLQYAPSVGGVGTATREIAQRLAARGDDVSVLTADATWHLPSEEEVNGVPVHRIRAWPRDGDQLLAPGILPFVHRGAWDIIHIQGYQAGVAPLTMMAAARARIPYVLTFHGGGHSQSIRNRLRSTQLRILRPLLARASALIATAEWEIDRYAELLALPRARFALIPNGGELAPPADEVPPQDGTVLVSIGRLERYKGHQHAIAALPEVVASVPDARLWIAGDGPYESELRALAGRLGVADRVEIFAERDRHVFSARLHQASVGLLLSEFETHPMAAMEALTAGLPMVVTEDGGGLSELVQKDLAMGVALDAPPRLHARAIVRAIQDPPPPPTMVLPSWDDAADSLSSLYRSIIATRRPPAVEAA